MEPVYATCLQRGSDSRVILHAARNSRDRRPERIYESPRHSPPAWPPLFRSAVISSLLRPTDFPSIPEPALHLCVLHVCLRVGTYVRVNRAKRSETHAVASRRRENLKSSRVPRWGPRPTDKRTRSRLNEPNRLDLRAPTRTFN